MSKAAGEKWRSMSDKVSRSLEYYQPFVLDLDLYLVLNAGERKSDLDRSDSCFSLCAGSPHGQGRVDVQDAEGW